MRHRPLVSIPTLEPSPCPEGPATRRVGALPLELLCERTSDPFTVALDAPAGVVEVRDRGSDVRYELGLRGRQGAGWSERSQIHGDAVELSVSAAEVIAVVREAGRDEEVAELTLALACTCTPRVAGRLRREVRRGHELERVSVRPFQLLVLESLVAGEPISAMCERGRFLLADGRPDTSWFLRRVGLSVSVCSLRGEAFLEARRWVNAAFGLRP